LTTIIGAVEVLQAGAKEDPAERDRFLGHIERESGRLARLARAMLTLARAHSGQEQPRVEAVELAPLLRDVAGGLEPHAGLAIVRESVRTLGARIELDSSPGQGTVFRIMLAPARVREEVPAA